MLRHRYYAPMPSKQQPASGSQDPPAGRIARTLKRPLEPFRARLATANALPQLAFLAIIAGALTGVVSVAFRMAIEGGALAMLDSHAEAFEELHIAGRIIAPIGAALLIGLALTRLSTTDRRVGVTHVMERLSRHQGHMPLRNAAIQFFGGVVALSAGISGGREGPAVHLGAATSSFLGELFRLPNNSVRTLVACGTAGAVAASFNTPMAGVIFAMEVVMMEYAIASFVPVILAAVTATVISRYVFGDAPAFAVPAVELGSLLELPYIALAGVLVGITAAAFIFLTRRFNRLEPWPFWARATAAGIITAAVGLVAPDVLGIGYDTVDAALLGDVAWTTLIIILIGKMVASAACVGTGLPVGVITPTLVMGAVLGGLLGTLGNALAPDAASSPALYVMLGMAAMMAAVLQAPLAALVAVLELTANPNIILPAMLIVVTASLTVSVAFRQRSIFLGTLADLGLQYPPDPRSRHLLASGVGSLMRQDFARLPRRTDTAAAWQGLESDPLWIVVDGADGNPQSVLNAADLRTWLAQRTVRGENLFTAEGPTIDLMTPPGLRMDVVVVNERATLHEALERLEDANVEAVCVEGGGAAGGSVVGVITRDDIEDFTRMGQNEG